MARKLVTLLVIVSFATLVFAFAGCGGDGDSSASGDTTETTETVATEDTETTETETTETTDTETTETEDTETTETSGSDDFASAENCQEFAQIGSQLSEAVSGSVDVDQIKSTFDQLAAAAPAEIKSDFETLAEYMGQVAEALQGVDLTSGQVPPAEALAKLAQLDSAAATTASQNVSKWVTENCTGVTP
jgi:hypothetical protein